MDWKSMSRRFDPAPHHSKKSWQKCRDFFCFGAGKDVGRITSNVHPYCHSQSSINHLRQAFRSSLSPEKMFYSVLVSYFAATDTVIDTAFRTGRTTCSSDHRVVRPVICAPSPQKDTKFRTPYLITGISQAVYREVAGSSQAFVPVISLLSPCYLPVIPL